MSDQDQQERKKATRKPHTPNLAAVIQAIKRGEYDEQFSELLSSVQEHNEARRSHVINLVHEVFGPDAVVEYTPKGNIGDFNSKDKPEEIASESPKKNPFFKTTKVKATADVVEEEKALPGPYKIDPVDGNTRRVSGPIDDEGFLMTTDIFGSHESRVLASIWESWDSPPNALDQHLDEVERKMNEEDHRPDDAETPSQSRSEIPIERRGAEISGLHSSDIAG